MNDENKRLALDYNMIFSGAISLIAFCFFLYLSIRNYLLGITNMGYELFIASSLLYAIISFFVPKKLILFYVIPLFLFILGLILEIEKASPQVYSINAYYSFEEFQLFKIGASILGIIITILYILLVKKGYFLRQILVVLLQIEIFISILYTTMMILYWFQRIWGGISPGNFMYEVVTPSIPIIILSISIIFTFFTEIKDEKSSLN